MSSLEGGKRATLGESWESKDLDLKETVEGRLGPVVRSTHAPQPGALAGRARRRSQAGRVFWVGEDETYLFLSSRVKSPGPGVSRPRGGAAEAGLGTSPGLRIKWGGVVSKGHMRGSSVQRWDCFLNG